MKQISFSGASDDLVHVGGSPQYDEINTEQAVFHTAGLEIKVAYGRSGTWSVQAGQIDESIPVTAENVRVEVSKDTPYSMLLTMDVPDESYVTLVKSD